MRNYRNSVLILIMALLLSSCGGGGATSGDPLGTDSITVSASVTSLNAGQSSVIKATVKSVSGTLVTGRTVTFSFRANSSGGTLSIINNETKGNGEAIVSYTAGANSPLSSVTDTIQASISNGASDAVVIARAAGAGGGGGATSQVSLLTASKPTLSAGQNSIISVKITDTAGNAISGETVTFSIPIKNSGVPTLSALSAVTDGGGNAITIYSPGTASPTSTVEDAVQASITNGSTKAVIIARSGSSVTATSISTLDASQTTLNTSQSCIITANVTDSAGNPVMGETVTFSMPIKNTGSPTLSALSAVTDGRGNAITIYAPGIGSPANTVTDTIQASLTNGSTRAIIITRSGSAAVTATAISTLTTSQTALTANRSSIITVNVIDASGNPVSGETVTFTIPIKNSGVPILSATTSITDGRGNAISIYTPGTASPTTTVEDVIQASLSSGSTRAIAITRSGDSQTDTAISALTPSKTTLTANQSSIITANVTDSAGNPVSGETVTFSIAVNNSGAPALVPLTASTDGRGNAMTIYTAGASSPTSNVEDIIQASLANGSVRAVTITRSGNASTATAISALTPSQSTLASTQSSIITANVTDSAGNPVSGETVTFAISVNNSGAPALAPLTAVTDGKGNAITVYKPGTVLPTSTVEDVIQASLTNGSVRAITITRSGNSATATAISTLTPSKTTLTVNQSSIIAANVTDSAGNPVSGETVTFSIAVNNSGAAALAPLTASTDGRGNAMTIYTAGASSPTSNVEDIIQARLANGSVRAVTITRSGNASTATAISALTPSQSTLASTQSSIITANVTDSAGNPVSGETVTFAISVNNSGAPALAPLTAVTDGKGNAITVYKPGTVLPTSTVEDVIQASIANGSVRAVTITRSGNTVTTTAISALTPSQTTLVANRSSIITANVTNSSNAPVSGETVTFSIPVNNSGAPPLTNLTAVTDGRGNAITIYTPGVTSPTGTVEDVIQASIANGSVRAVTMTRSGNAVTATAISTLNPSQSTVTASQSSIITANITDSAGNPVIGETVTFSIPIKNSGVPTLSVASGATDGKGTISTVYTPGSVSSSNTVEDVVQASLSNGSTRVLIITRSGGATVSDPILSQLTADPTLLGSGHISLVTAVVANASGTPVSGETVTFSLPVKNTGSPTLTPAAGTALTTDGNGRVVSLYSPGTASPTDSVDDAVQATITGSSRAVIITRSSQTALANTVTLTSNCASAPNAGDSCVLTAMVQNASGNPVNGVTVQFDIFVSASGAPYLNNTPLTTTRNVTTGADGKAIEIYTAGVTANRTDVVKASIAGADTAIIIWVK